MNFADCKKCGNTIRWATTPKGRHVPLDPIPTRNGSVRMGIDDKAEFLTGWPRREALDRGEKLYELHTFTCEATWEDAPDG